MTNKRRANTQDSSNMNRYAMWLAAAPSLKPQYDYFHFAEYVQEGVKMTNTAYSNTLTKAIQKATKSTLPLIISALNLYRVKQNSPL
jgi:hypothetical protein